MEIPQALVARLFLPGDQKLLYAFSITLSIPLYHNKASGEITEEGGGAVKRSTRQVNVSWTFSWVSWL